MNQIINTNFHVPMFKNTQLNNKPVIKPTPNDSVEIKNEQQNSNNTPRELSLGGKIFVGVALGITAVILGLLLIEGIKSLGNLKEDELYLLSILDDLDLAARK